jgi:hypothetical protein
MKSHSENTGYIREYYLLEYNVVYFGTSSPTFCRNVLPLPVGGLIYSLTLKKEAVLSSETLLPEHHIPEDGTVLSHLCTDLKSNMGHVAQKGS